MRQFFVILLLIPVLLFSQKKTNEKIDSTAYYIELVKFNKGIDNYKNCLLYSQKALDYAHRTNNQKSIADSYSNLGAVYLELKKFNDAIDVLIKSIAIYTTYPSSSEQAFAHYSLGVCYMEKNNFTMAEQNFNKAGIIYERLKTPKAIEMIDLQKGIVYIEKGRLDLAMPLLEKIIAHQDTADTYKTKAEALYQIGKIEIKKRGTI